MNRADWVIGWPASLIPDLACVPGDEAFLGDAGGYSLLANASGRPGLLFTSPDALSQYADQMLKQKKRQRKRRRRTR